jgi:hypothetical protein
LSENSMIEDLPIRSPADECHLSRAIGVLMGKGLRGNDVAWALLRLAVDIDNREKRLGPNGFRNSMPAFARSREELSDAYAQRLIDIAEGAKFTCEPSGPELDLLAAIDKVFRGALRDHAVKMQDAGKVTRGPNADFQMLWDLASGKSQRTVARELGISQPRVAHIKRTHLATIWRAIRPPMIARPAPGGFKQPTCEAPQSEGFTNYVATDLLTFVGGREKTPSKVSSRMAGSTTSGGGTRTPAIAVK